MALTAQQWRERMKKLRQRQRDQIATMRQRRWDRNYPPPDPNWYNYLTEDDEWSETPSPVISPAPYEPDSPPVKPLPPNSVPVAAPLGIGALIIGLGALYFLYSKRRTT